MTPPESRFPVRRSFVEAHAKAQGVDYEACYRGLLEKTRAHLTAELARLEAGESFRVETRFLVAERTVPREAVISAYLVVGDLRDEGYAADTLRDSSVVTGDRLWLTIKLI